MAERIKKELLNCKMMALQGGSYSCASSSKLIEYMAEIKKLSNEDFLDVNNYAQTLNLPIGFLRGLKNHYRSRQRKSDS